MAQPPAREGQELAVVGQPEHDLGERERDELGVGDPGWPAGSPPFRQEVVHQHVNCREKGVEVGVHVGSFVDVALATPSFGALRAVSSQRDGNLESVI